jgi:hypothetical protein
MSPHRRPAIAHLPEPRPGDAQLRTCASPAAAERLAAGWNGILARLQVADVYEAYPAFIPLPRNAAGQSFPLFGVYLHQSLAAEAGQIIEARARLLAWRARNPGGGGHGTGPARTLEA